jgi:hypothetical protein
MNKKDHFIINPRVDKLFAKRNIIKKIVLLLIEHIKSDKYFLPLQTL